MPEPTYDDGATSQETTPAAVEDRFHALPHKGPIARATGRAILKSLGWKVVGEFPNVPRAVFIASPHTSYLDGMFMVATAYSLGIKLSWMGKNSLFRFPFGPLIRAVGGISIDRSKSNDTVQQISKEFSSRDSMFLAIAPAGTRSKHDYWKSGFYHIASEANIPMLCGCVDFVRKEVGIIGVVHPTGDMAADMDRIRSVYEGRKGRHPDRMTRIRLRAEDPPMRAVP